MAARRKKAVAKRSAKKRAAPRTRPAAKKAVVKKRAAKKRAPKKRTVAKRPAKQRTAPRRTAKKRAPARKQAAKRRAAPKRAAKQRAGRRTPKPRAVVPAFAPQRAAASAKDLLLFELERARVAVLAAIQGLGAGSAMRPVAEGKWTIHEVVLHLAVRDQVRLDEFDALLAGTPASWAGITDPAVHAEINERHLAALRHLTWDEAVRLLHRTRAELVARLQGVPEEPAGTWSAGHALGAVLLRLPEHDRKHAETIKNARVAG